MKPTAQAKPGVPAAEPQKPSRMTLSNLVVGKRNEPRRILVSGVEGIGKSTFASESASPIFLGAEDGTGQLDVQRFPTPETFQEVLEAIVTLTREEHAFKTLVIDTVDWLEPLVWAHICRRDNKTNIEDYGYGKGYQTALDEWRRLLKGLEMLRAAKKMEILMLAHTHLKSFKNPLGDDFDRYELKLNLKAAGLLKEWCDAVLFANYEQFAVKTNPGDKMARAKGVATGARVLNTERSAAYDAKNRFSLPPVLPLDWATFDEACKAQQVAAPEVLVSQLEEASSRLAETKAAQVKAGIVKAQGDARKLAQLLSWANANLAAQAAESEAKS